MVTLRRTASRRQRLMSLDAAVAALGRDGDMGTRYEDAPVDRIVGSAARSADFDVAFRLVNPVLRDRWERVAAVVRSGQAPPIRLIRLGDLYFVVDGHHRVSVARHDGHVVVAANVHRICTVAYAMACLRAEHLDSKRAERGFPERVPLPHDVREQLWLDHPTDWVRLADSAEAWGLRRTMHSGKGVLDRDGLAVAWWRDEVEPALIALRAAGIGLGLRDVQLYVSALSVRDGLGLGEWPQDLPERMLESGNRLDPLASVAGIGRRRGVVTGPR